jgi:predicted GNAT family acetyltransferase
MSESKPTAIDVRHNPAERRFEAVVEGLLSVAEYERRGDEIVFTHTVVPSALRGRGIAEAIVRSALAYARDERLRVVPACSYVAAFVQRHAEYQSLLNETGARPS